MNDEKVNEEKINEEKKKRQLKTTLMITLFFFIVTLIGIWPGCAYEFWYIVPGGAVVCLFSSYVCAKLTGLEPMGDYFKPFTSYDLIIVISVIVIILQTIVVFMSLHNRKNR